MKASGFTLLELIVVLVLLAVAAGVVAPSLLSSRPEGPSALRALIAGAREAAIRRGEIVRLRIDGSGAWQAVAGASSRSEVFLSGRLAEPPAGSSDILFSPLGTCAPSVENEPAAEVLRAFDPLTCEERPR
ncbi:MAG: prepilin-type N-terminal cleavage/methylation domain-containing protein [Gemmatimonadales bacterium]